MERLKYFLDTYAMIEISKGSKEYKKYIGLQLFTSVFNLYELYFLLLRDFNDEELARKQFLRFKEISIKVTDESIFNASKFRVNNLKKHFSYADAIGYILSLENGCIFLTGDDAFKSLKNVLFVK